jgi:lysophospholipase L1-like esterase
MWFRSLFSSLTYRSIRGRDLAEARRVRWRYRPALEPLDERVLPSATATIAAMGDSLTASYQGRPQGAAGDQNWVQQLQAEGDKHLAIDDVAVPGATSADLGGQVAAVARLVQAGSVQYATLIIGANDVAANLPTIFAGNPTPFVTEVVGHIESALDTVAAAGNVGLVVGNIPDISISPAFEARVPSPLLRYEVAQATALANQQIETFAASRGIPVIDLFALSHLAEAPITLAGVQVNNWYAPDHFHPGTIAQGLLADTILEALGDAYDPSLERFALNEQQLLDNAPTPIPHGPGHTFFDASPYVLLGGNHDVDPHANTGRSAVAVEDGAGDGDTGVAWTAGATEGEGLETLEQSFIVVNGRACD